MDAKCPFDIPVALLAGFIAIIGEVWYSYSIYQNKTRPDRLAWWILGISGIIFTWSHFVLGGTWTVAVPAIITLGMIVTAIMSIWRGAKLSFTIFDKAALMIAISSLLIWWYIGDPRIALFTNITISTVAMAMCIRKAYLLLGSEAPGPWAVTVFADALNMCAIGQGSLEWVLPTNFLATDVLMLITVITRKGRDTRKRVVDLVKQYDNERSGYTPRLC